MEISKAQSYRTDFFNPPIPFLTGDGAVLHSIITEIERVRHLEPWQVREHQQTLLDPLLKHFIRHDPWFRKRVGRKFDASGFSSLKPVGKEYFQALVAKNESYAKNIPQHHLPTYWAETSGSTGTPLRIQKTSISRAITMAHLPWNHLASNSDFSWKLASVKPTNTGVQHSESWDGATDLLFRTGGMLSVSSSEDVFTQLHNLELYQPDILIVFPSVLAEYCQLWSSGKREAIPLKVIRTMGETLSKETRQLAETLTGATVLDTYSSSEVGRIATQIAKDEPYVVNNYSLIVEVLREDGAPCSKGEVGRVVITDLSNYATPLIRYDIGDYAAPEDDECVSLRLVKGRSRNMVALPDGRKVWPLVGYRDFTRVLPIRQFRIQQVQLDLLHAAFHVESMPTPSQEEEICRIVRESLGYNFTMKCTFQTEPLNKGNTGKLEDFVSLVV